jgi:hypothetical protein
LRILPTASKAGLTSRISMACPPLTAVVGREGTVFGRGCRDFDSGSLGGGRDRRGVTSTLPGSRESGMGNCQLRCQHIPPVFMICSGATFGFALEVILLSQPTTVLTDTRTLHTRHCWIRGSWSLCPQGIVQCRWSGN